MRAVKFGIKETLHFLSNKADMSVTHEVARLAALIPSRFVSCLGISVEENLFDFCFLVCCVLTTISSEPALLTIG